jgi:tetratricopeptide (TPR) repeat protein
MGFLRKSASECIDVGDQYYESGDYLRAVEEYTKAVKRDPSYATSYIRRGCAYDKLEDYEKSIIDYTKVLSLNSYSDGYNVHTSAYSSRGDALNKIGKYNEAISDFIADLKIDPSFSPCFSGLGEGICQFSPHKRPIKSIYK